MIKKLSLIILFLALSTVVVAEQPTASENQSQPNSNVSPTLYCPEPGALIKDPRRLNWGTTSGGWVMYNKSFATSVAKFTGAHWVGVMVGRMICTYEAADKLAFPISLQSTVYIKSPDGPTWTKNIKGIKNCPAEKVTDCPFTQSSTKPKGSDMESLQKLRRKPIFEKELGAE